MFCGPAWQLLGIQKPPWPLQSFDLGQDGRLERGLFLSSAAQSQSWLEKWRLCDPLAHDGTLSGFVSEPIRLAAGALRQTLGDHRK